MKKAEKQDTHLTEQAVRRKRQKKTEIKQKHRSGEKTTRKSTEFM